ncbi:MAG: hypothetical protein WB697_07090 [Stellaceae bacterium]
MAIRWLVTTIGLIVIGSCATPPVMAQNSDSFREDAPTPAPHPRPSLAPKPEQEPVFVPRQAAPARLPYDGAWVGMHRCPEFNNRQAFEHPLMMQITNGRASAVTNLSPGTPGYVAFDGMVAPDGRLGLRGYAISRGQPGASPAGTKFPFDYDGAIAGDTYTAHDLGSRPCTIELFRQR